VTNHKRNQVNVEMQLLWYKRAYNSLQKLKPETQIVLLYSVQQKKSSINLFLLLALFSRTISNF